MLASAVDGDARPCLWMSAGLLSYKLCDRQFDCERCPLDAALRGQSLAVSQTPAPLMPDPRPMGFPVDRLYTPGHSWIQPVERRDVRFWRFGLDALAAAVVGWCRGITWNLCEGMLAPGESICRIDMGLGILSIGAPVRSVVLERHHGLEREPGQLVGACYQEGWIAHLVLADANECDGLMTARQAEDRAHEDLQHFRRQVARQMLSAESAAVGPSLADGGELVADLRQMLGGQAYLKVVREMVC